MHPKYILVHESVVYVDVVDQLAQEVNNLNKIVLAWAPLFSKNRSVLQCKQFSLIARDQSKLQINNLFVALYGVALVFDSTTGV